MLPSLSGRPGRRARRYRGTVPYRYRYRKIYAHAHSAFHLVHAMPRDMIRARATLLDLLEQRSIWIFYGLFEGEVVELTRILFIKLVEGAEGHEPRSLQRA